MLIAKEICKVRSCAVYPDVGKGCKSYEYAVVKRVNKASARISLLDHTFCYLATFTVKHNDLWKIKSNQRRLIQRKIVKKNIHSGTDVKGNGVDASLPNPLFTGCTDVYFQDVLLDGLKCVRHLEIYGTSSILTLAFDSVTNCTTGAIVNAANKGCLGGGGIDGRICYLGGPALDAARRALPTLDGSEFGPRCAIGDAKMTIAGDLPCEYVIHAVGPSFSCVGPFDEDVALLAAAYKRSMALARDKKLSKIAFCIISAGVFRGGCSLEKVVETGMKTIAEHVYPDLERVYFCAFTKEEQQACIKITNAVSDLR